MTTNRKRWIWAGVWLVLFVITSAIVFCGSRERAYGYGHGWGYMRDWGHMRDWGSMTPWPGHPYWQDEDGQWPGRMDGHGWHHMPGYGGDLLENLNAEQRDKAKQLMDAASSEKRVLLQQRNEAHEKLQKLYAGDTRDWSAIHAAAQSLMEAQGKLLNAAIDLEQKIDELRKPSQRK